MQTSISIVARTAASRSALQAELAGQGLYVVAASATLEGLSQLGEALLLDDADPALENGDLIDAVQRLPHSEHVVLVLAAAPDTWAAQLRRLPLRGWAVLPADAPADMIAAAVAAAVFGLSISTLPGQLTPQSSSELPGRHRPEADALSMRELEVLERVARGWPSKRIATDLGLSEATVKFHLGVIYARLDAGNRAEAISIAARRGLITL
jgi:DNA-binding NarL/FixJ family response regulator